MLSRWDSNVDTTEVAVGIDIPASDATVASLLRNLGFPAQSPLVKRFEELPAAILQHAKHEGPVYLVRGSDFSRSARPLQFAQVVTLLNSDKLRSLNP